MLSCTLTAIESGSLCRENTGLGNVLFQVSSVLGMALDTNREFGCFDAEILGAKLREWGWDHTNTIFRNIPKQKNKNYSVLNEATEYAQKFDKSIIDIIVANSEIPYLLNGYFQSHLYFHHHREKLLEVFAPNNATLQYIKNKYPILFSNSDTVFVHVRQKYGGTILYRPNYFYKAANLISTRLKNPQFLIFSDDVEWCKNNVLIPNAIYVEGNPDYVDLWAMSLCKHGILSHSTLSWWGAYLNQNPNKIVYYPEDALRIWWGRCHAKPVHTYRKEIHYLPEWECISCCTI